MTRTKGEAPHPHGQPKIVKPWLYRLPRDLDELAGVVGLPAQAVTELIDEGLIPVRVRLDSLGRKRWNCVLIHEVLDGITKSRLVKEAPRTPHV